MKMIKIKIGPSTVVKVEPNEEQGKLLIADIRKITERGEDCVGIACQDKEGCWVVSKLSEEGDLLPHAGGWDEAGEYSTWPLQENLQKMLHVKNQFRTTTTYRCLQWSRKRRQYR